MDIQNRMGLCSIVGKAQATGYRSRAWLRLSRNMVYCREPPAESHIDHRLYPGWTRGRDNRVAMMALADHHLVFFCLGSVSPAWRSFKAMMRAKMTEDLKSFQFGRRQSLHLNKVWRSANEEVEKA